MLSTLRIILANPQLHGRWLNTASYLEYVAARKILKGFPEHRIDGKLLAHALEELTHASLLKRAACLITGEDLDYEYENLLSGPASKTYIQTLDRQTLQTLGFSSRCRQISVPCYLYVTLLIQERAIEVYGTYSRLSQHTAGLTAIHRILKQNTRQFQEIKAQLSSTDPQFESIYDKLKTAEARLFGRLWNELTAEVCLDMPNFEQEEAAAILSPETRIADLPPPH